MNEPKEKSQIQNPNPEPEIEKKRKKDVLTGHWVILCSNNMNNISHHKSAWYRWDDVS